MLTYFKLSEFDSPDKKGSGNIMDLDFLLRLDEARKRAGFPFFVTSGVRTIAHNKKVGGVKNSAHITGHAADIRYKTIDEAISIVEAARKVGIQRIGIGNGFIHLDNDPTKKTPAFWTYPNTPAALKTRFFPYEYKKPISTLLMLTGVATAFYFLIAKKKS